MSRVGRLDPAAQRLVGLVCPLVMGQAETVDDRAFSGVDGKHETALVGHGPAGVEGVRVERMPAHVVKPGGMAAAARERDVGSECDGIAQAVVH